jgi:hypothetical protein
VAVSDWTVHTGDCLEVMAGMEANTFDAIVTDPPYGLAFMGKAWDHAVPGPEFFAAMLRVAKPGAHIVAFGGTRLYHRMTCAMEDAGWEIRDCLMWLYGSGFPKSHDVSKAIDREAGAEREVVGVSRTRQTEWQSRKHAAWVLTAKARGCLPPPPPPKPNAGKAGAPPSNPRGSRSCWPASRWTARWRRTTCGMGAGG